VPPKIAVQSRDPHDADSQTPLASIVLRLPVVLLAQWNFGRDPESCPPARTGDCGHGRLSREHIAASAEKRGDPVIAVPATGLAE
jgi:hypothetical protein